MIWKITNKFSLEFGTEMLADGKFDKRRMTQGKRWTRIYGRLFCLPPVNRTDCSVFILSSQHVQMENILFQLIRIFFIRREKSVYEERRVSFFWRIIQRDFFPLFFYILKNLSFSLYVFFFFTFSLVRSSFAQIRNHTLSPSSCFFLSLSLPFSFLRVCLAQVFLDNPM